MLAPENNDRRIRRTHNLLAEALIELTLEKSYDEVTIRDITERADVGYATFFRHYPDKKALLHNVLTVFVEELSAQLTIETSAISSSEEGTLIFRFVQQHSELSRLLLATHGHAAVVKAVIEAKATAGRQLGLDVPEKMLQIPQEIVINHWVATTLALIQWWFESGMNYSAEQMGDFYARLVVKATHALLFDGLSDTAEKTR